MAYFDLIEVIRVVEVVIDEVLAFFVALASELIVALFAFFGRECVVLSLL